MTLIETRLIRTILEKGMVCMTEAWESVKAIKFELREMESNPQIVQIVPPNEVVVVIGLEIKMTNRAGTMSLCIPFNVIEPLIEDLSSQSWFVAGRDRDDTKWSDMIADRLADAKLEIVGILAETSITLSELRHLEVGDMIVTDKPASAPVIMSTGGHPKFLANIGQHRGKRAIRIIRPTETRDRLSSSVGTG